jgi:hypothetical protein
VLTTVHPAPASGTNNCTDPGYVADAGNEAIVDAEWASAAAPSAASCANTNASHGFFIAAENLINRAKPPAIIATAVLALFLGLTTPAFAQTVGVTAARAAITQPIDPAKLATLSGNTRSEALNPANDRGMVADTLPMPHILLQRPSHRS